ncbi:MAG: TlpA family protein disulfide reductase [Chloroflexota bacterium]
MTRRNALQQLGLGGMAALAAACTAPSAVPSASTPSSAVKPAPPLTIALANSELVVGPNRLAMGLIGPDNQPISDAQAVVSLYQLEGTQGTKVAEAEATYRWVEYRQRGVYVSRAAFDRPGPWGVEVVARVSPDSAPVVARVTVDIRERGHAPMIGDTARATRSLTATDVSDLTAICSNGPPCSLHGQSIAAAIQSGRPSLLAFATPGFCTTLTCAPQLSVVLDLAPRYTGRAEFVHIEIFKEPRDRVLADAVAEWQLLSEPWIFIVDRNGVIRDRFEGIATGDELAESLRELL